MNFVADVLSRFRRSAGTPLLPEGQRVYAVGDIHGFADRLDELAGRIAADLDDRPPAAALIVFVGDYVDRGPASAAVIERMVVRDFACPIVTLRGNHEAMMLDALADAGAMEQWCDTGGAATLRSYGVDTSSVERGRGYAAARADLLARLPEPHCAFLDETLLHHTIGRYVFVHAGLRPGVALHRQDPDDLLWIRDDFFRAADSFDDVIVHGHTPCRRPESEPHRINVDTGVFKYGVLSCAVLEGAERRFISTRG